MKRLRHAMLPTEQNLYLPGVLRGYALRGMCLLVFLSFASTNVQALLWQSSDWLVGAILPAVVVDLTNQERQTLAAAPLQRNAVLDAAAQMKAEHMAKEGYFAHYSPQGVTPWHWFNEAGYSFVHAGENLAIHFSDSGAVVNAWMNSPSHRANIVDPKYYEIGVGTTRGRYQGFETVFVVQLFGAPALPPAPLVTTVDPTSVVAMTDLTAGQVRPSSEQVAGVSELAVGGRQVAQPVATSYPDTIDYPITIAAPLAADTLVTTGEDFVVMSDAIPSAPADSVVVDALPDTLVSTDTSQELVSIYLGTMSSSTLLMPATIEATLAGNAGTSAPILGRLATQPSTVLQAIYLIIGGLVGLALFSSVLLEWRRHHPLQVAYGVLLLCLMSGLFYLHVSLLF